MTFRVSMLLKRRMFLTCFRACFLPGRAKGLAAPQYWMSCQSPSLALSGAVYCQIP